MRRFVIAAVLVAALGPAVGAQQPIPTQPPPKPQPVPAMPVPQLPELPPVPPPPAVYHPDVYVPPGARPGPAIPFHKSTGVVVGAYGFYPYDTGEWLLGGTDGLTRQSGSFTMVAPGVFPAAPARRHPHLNHPLFRR
jgi:hypothetical protein